MYKFLIYHDNRFIHPKLIKEGIDIQFLIIIDLFTFLLEKREYKFSIHNNNRFIYLLPIKREYKFFIENNS